MVRNFSIHTEDFADTHDVDDAVTPGIHRVMWFDFLSLNKGDADLAVGNPAHPEWFVMSASHSHYPLIDFNEFRLYDAAGDPGAAGAKQAFCPVDIEQVIRALPNSRPATQTKAQAFCPVDIEQVIRALPNSRPATQTKAFPPDGLMSTPNRLRVRTSSSMAFPTVTGPVHRPNRRPDPGRTGAGKVRSLEWPARPYRFSHAG